MKNGTRVPEGGGCWWFLINVWHKSGVRNLPSSTWRRGVPAAANEMAKWWAISVAIGGYLERIPSGWKGRHFVCVFFLVESYVYQKFYNHVYYKIIAKVRCLKLHIFPIYPLTRVIFLQENERKNYKKLICSREINIFFQLKDVKLESMQIDKGVIWILPFNWKCFIQDRRFALQNPSSSRWFAFFDTWIQQTICGYFPRGYILTFPVPHFVISQRASSWKKNVQNWSKWCKSFFFLLRHQELWKMDAPSRVQTKKCHSHVRKNNPSSVIKNRELHNLGPRVLFVFRVCAFLKMGAHKPS